MSALPTQRQGMTNASLVASLEAELVRQEQELEEELRLELARKDLLAFVQHTYPEYAAGWFHQEVCEKLERFSAAVARGESPRLILSAPPRHGKTFVVSQRWPIWHLAQHAGHEIACASYAQDLADDNSREARTVARSAEVAELFPDIRPQKQQKAWFADYKRADVDKISLWKVGNGGSYKAVGVGGPLTGRGCHILIIDDPIKDAAEANSATKREAVWQWYCSTARTRVAPGGGVLVMMTRWHEDDLVGRLLNLAKKDPDADQWEVINFPAIAEVDEEHRAAGEPLHEERWPISALEALKASVGAAWWAALFQGRPTPAGGNQIKRGWFKERYRTSPFQLAATADEVWISVDAAKKKTDTSDYHSMQVWARKGAKYALLDRICERFTYPEFEVTLDDLHAKWATWRSASLIEDTANGTTYLQCRSARIAGLIPFHPTTHTPGKDKSKAARAVYLERAAEAGQIVLPDGDLCPWIGDWLVCVCSFPGGLHDDDVDAASQLIMRWVTQEGGGNYDDFYAELGLR